MYNSPNIADLHFGRLKFSVVSENDEFMEGIRKFFICNRIKEPDFIFNVSFSLDSTHVKKEGLRPFSYGRTSGFFSWKMNRLDLIFNNNEIIKRPFNFLPVFFSVFYTLERTVNVDEYCNVFLHAAGIIKDEYGYVFTGPSGSGKSTVCEYSMPGSVVTSDELVLISRRNGKSYLCNSPIKGKIYAMEKLKKRIKAIFILKKDSDDYLVRLKRPESITELLSCVTFDECFGFLDESEYMLERLRLALSVSRWLPVYALHFRKGKGFWSAIRNTLE